jgi:hypothetical protein
VAGVTPNDAILALQALELLEPFTVRADIAAKHVVLSKNVLHGDYGTSRGGSTAIKLRRRRPVSALIEIRLRPESRAASSLGAA